MGLAPPPVSVRLASAEDAETLAELRTALFHELGRTLTPEHLAAFEALSAGTFEAGLRQGSCAAWLALTVGGKAVGSAVLLVFPRFPSPESLARFEGYLLNVYTRPEWRKRGVATALLAAAPARGRELGLARIRLHATIDGRPIYSAAGFRARADEMELRL